MESTSLFYEMNSDMSKIYQNNKQYLKALNMRPLTTLGGSNGALENIVGNQLQSTFPLVQNIYKLKLDNGTVAGNVTITINGQSITFPTNQNSVIHDIYLQLKLLPNCYNDTYSSNKDFAVITKDDAIYVYMQPEYGTNISNLSVDPNIVITASNGVKRPIFYGNNGGTNTSQIVYVEGNTPGDTLTVIGSTYILDTNYLFTCGTYNVGRTGQIWSLVYNEVTKLTTLKLLYHAYLDFSINNTIPPTAATSRYELPTIQRIYWSDFNNPIRSINVVDPNLMGLNPEIINLVPSILLSVPTLKSVNVGGSVIPLNTNSSYQCAYRLRKNNSTITNFSIPSNIVYPVNNQRDFSINSTNFSSLEGTQTQTDKTITWEVSGIDTNYDTIEFFVIYKGAGNLYHTINKYEEKTINGTSTISTTFVNDSSTYEEVSLNEFLIENSSFTHAKTIEQKDNRLFFGNVKSSLSDYLETFDTRTYRFASNSNNINVKVLDTDTNTRVIDISSTPYSTLSKDLDMIPSINLGMSIADDPDYNRSYRFQRNSTTVGGEGPNIKYSFGSMLLRSDEQANLPTTPANPGNSFEGSTRDAVTSNIYNHGYRVAGVINNTNSPFVPTYSNIAPDQTYYTNQIRQTMGHEMYSGNYKSYQHNEIYRCGIVFHSKNGNTYFVKWIGDIKMPDYSDIIDKISSQGVTDTGVRCPDHRSMFRDGDAAYCNMLYINFQVTIPDALSKLISGYQIVRCKRESQDRTIPAHGLFTQVMGTDGNDGYLPISHSISLGGTNSMDPANGVFNIRAKSGEIAFHSFNYLADKDASQFSRGDRLIVNEIYKIYNGFSSGGVVWPNSTPIGGSFEQYYYIKKYMDFGGCLYNNIPGCVHTVNDAVYAGIGDDAVLPITGTTYHNRDFQYNVSTSKYYSDGSPVIIVGIDRTIASINWASYNFASCTVVNGNSKLLGLHFKPSRLKSQYGGRTNVARTSCKYISCGAFTKIVTAGSYNLRVFGGDVFHGVLDIQKAIKNTVGGPTTPTTGLFHSQTWFFPTQSVYNVDLRNGVHVNSDLNDTSGSDARTNDEYLYLSGYSIENDINEFFPEPSVFNLTSSFQNRVCWSEVKINGETTDSWNIIPVDNKYDVDGKYGGINSMTMFNNYVYFIQDSSFGRLEINPVTIISTNDGQQLELAAGTNILRKHNYISTDVGTKHQWSVCKSPSTLSFCDIRHKAIFQYNGEQLVPISDFKGHRGFVNKIMRDVLYYNDNPIGYLGIIATYDHLNNEFLYTFHALGADSNGGLANDSYTLVYSDITGSFTSFYSFTPYIYINNNTKFYTPQHRINGNDTKLYIHNIGNRGEFYGIKYPSTVKVNINANPYNLKTKVFDNLTWNTENIQLVNNYVDEINDQLSDSKNINYLDSTFTRVRCYNEYQNTDWLILDNTPITGNIRRNEQGWNIQVPRNMVNYDSNSINTKSIFDPTVLTKTTFGDRMRDKYLIVDLEYDNSTNNRFILHNINSNFRVSDR